MAFVVEDGTGLSNATSYGTFAAAQAYFAARGIATWAGLSQPTGEQHLFNATEYLGLVYGQRWLGTRKTETQALDFPMVDLETRDGFTVPDDIVPVPVFNAMCEVAELIRSGEILLPTVAAEAKGIKRQRDKVDVLETETEWTGAKGTFKTYTRVEAILMSAGYITGPGELRRS